MLKPKRSDGVTSVEIEKTYLRKRKEIKMRENIKDASEFELGIHPCASSSSLSIPPPPTAHLRLAFCQLLFKHGVSLVGAINFFSENIATLAFKSIDDTLQTWEEYQRARLDHDAERDSLSRRDEVCLNISDFYLKY